MIVEVIQRVKQLQRKLFVLQLELVLEPELVVGLVVELVLLIAALQLED